MEDILHKLGWAEQEREWLRIQETAYPTKERGKETPSDDENEDARMRAYIELEGKQSRMDYIKLL